MGGSPVGGAVVCSVHGKTRSEMSLMDDGTGGLLLCVIAYLLLAIVAAILFYYCLLLLLFAVAITSQSQQWRQVLQARL